MIILLPAIRQAAGLHHQRAERLQRLALGRCDDHPRDLVVLFQHLHRRPHMLRGEGAELIQLQFGHAVEFGWIGGGQTEDAEQSLVGRHGQDHPALPGRLMCPDGGGQGRHGDADAGWRRFHRDLTMSAHAPAAFNLGQRGPFQHLAAPHHRGYVSRSHRCSCSPGRPTTWPSPITSVAAVYCRRPDGPTVRVRRPPATR